jgi:nitroreductase
MTRIMPDPTNPEESITDPGHRSCPSKGSEPVSRMSTAWNAPPMELRDAIRARRMVRTYDPDRPVPRDVLTDLLDLATRAPSAGFTQGWDFVVLHTPRDVGRFWAATGGPGPDADAWLTGMMSAPALVLCLSDRERYLDRYAEPDKGWSDRDEERWPVPYWDVDTGMAGLLMLLGAVDEGLGGCFFGVPAPKHAAVLAEFAVPALRRIVGVVSLGYRAPDRRSPSLKRGRRPLSEVAHEGGFGIPWAPGSAVEAKASTSEEGGQGPDQGGQETRGEFDQQAQADRGDRVPGRGPGGG